LASPIFATAVGLLKHTIDNYGGKTSYVEEFTRITDEAKSYDAYTSAQKDLNNRNTAVNNQDDDEYEDEQEKQSESPKKKGLFNKLFTYTKDFFETVPDSDF
jgi:predicted double-glycine peptidase